MGIDGNGGSEELAVPSRNLAMDFIVSIHLRNHNLDNDFMSDDEIIAVVQAHKEGKKIQFAFKHNSYSWYDVVGNHPNWNFEQLEYRVAPKPREWTLYFYNGVLTHICPTTLNYETIRVREVIEEDSRSTVQRMMEHATGFKND